MLVRRVDLNGLRSLSNQTIKRAKRREGNQHAGQWLASVYSLATPSRVPFTFILKEVESNLTIKSSFFQRKITSMAVAGKIILAAEIRSPKSAGIKAVYVVFQSGAHFKFPRATKLCSSVRSKNSRPLWCSFNLQSSYSFTSEGYPVTVIQWRATHSWCSLGFSMHRLQWSAK